MVHHSHHHHSRRRAWKYTLQYLTIAAIGIVIWLIFGPEALCFVAFIALTLACYHWWAARQRSKILKEIAELNEKFNDKNLSREENFRISDRLDQLSRKLARY